MLRKAVNELDEDELFVENRRENVEIRFERERERTSQREDDEPMI